MAARNAPKTETSTSQVWNPRLALLVAATFFMEFLDGTILTTAIPSIAGDFQVPAADVNITMTAYLMTVAMGIPLSGWLAERMGARRVFCMAIALFTIASLACALSPDLNVLTLSRILQGAGGAMMVPVGMLVVLRGTPKSDLLRATAFLIWPALLAPVLAPLVGGALTTYLSWHWIFLINLPLGAAAFITALRLIPAGAGDRGRRLDWVGLLLTTTGVGALVVGLELASAHPDGPWAAMSAAAGVCGLTAAVLWMRRAKAPLFDLTVFSTRTFRAMATGGFCIPPDHHIGAIPPAADVPDRLRLDTAARRNHGGRRVRRQHRHQAGHYPADPTLRFPCHVGLRLPGLSGDLRAVRPAYS